MYAATASIFFLLTTAGAATVIGVSLADNAAQIRAALGLDTPDQNAVPSYVSRVRRTSLPYRQVRPAPVHQQNAAA